MLHLPLATKEHFEEGKEVYAGSGGCFPNNRPETAQDLVDNPLLAVLTYYSLQIFRDLCTEALQNLQSSTNIFPQRTSIWPEFTLTLTGIKLDPCKTYFMQKLPGIGQSSPFWLPDPEQLLPSPQQDLEEEFPEADCPNDFAGDASCSIVCNPGLILHPDLGQGQGTFVAHIFGPCLLVRAVHGNVLNQGFALFATRKVSGAALSRVWQHKQCTIQSIWKIQQIIFC